MTQIGDELSFLPFFPLCACLSVYFPSFLSFLQAGLSVPLCACPPFSGNYDDFTSECDSDGSIAKAIQPTSKEEDRHLERKLEEN